MNTPQLYEEWSDDPDHRSYEAEATLGAAINANFELWLPAIVQKFQKQHKDVDAQTMEKLVRSLMWQGVYYAAMVFDGVAPSPVDSKHSVRWEINAQVVDNQRIVDTVNVLPSGDGLCYAFHDWHDIGEG